MQGILLGMFRPFIFFLPSCSLSTYIKLEMFSIAFWVLPSFEFSMRFFYYQPQMLPAKKIRTLICTKMLGQNKVILPANFEIKCHDRTVTRSGRGGNDRIMSKYGRISTSNPNKTALGMVFFNYAYTVKYIRHNVFKNKLCDCLNTALIRLMSLQWTFAQFKYTHQPSSISKSRV